MEPPDAGRRGAEDLISGLPDELLHCILLRLPSTAAAARTSLLSRRWRRVWAHMPDLVFCCDGLRDGPAPASSVFLDSVDAALDAYSAPTLCRFEINMSICDPCHVPASRIARWLRFASRRLAGRLDLHLSMRGATEDSDKEFDLPVWERVTKIKLVLQPNFTIRLPPDGSFAALTVLRVILSTINGRELGCLVSSQCPRLRKLVVLLKLAADCDDVSIRSDSLVSLFYCAYTGKLEVVTPSLEKISVSLAAEAYIVAPNLKKVVWHEDAYVPSRHQFAVVNRHLQRLWIEQTSMLLMRRFDTVNKLRLSLSISEGTEGYQSFLKDTDKVPICETLWVEIWADHHAFTPTMLHLLGRWRSIRKLKLWVDPRSPSTQRTAYSQHLAFHDLIVSSIRSLNPVGLVTFPPIYWPSGHILAGIQIFPDALAVVSQLQIERCRMMGCPCRLPESYRADNITFGSLEEIEISNFTGSSEQEKFIKFLLSRCNAEKLNSLKITMSYQFVSSEIKGVCKEIHSICHSNSKVKFNVLGEMGEEPFLF